MEIDLLELFAPLFRKITITAEELNYFIKRCNEMTEILKNSGNSLSSNWQTMGKYISKLQTYYYNQSLELKNIIMNYDEQNKENNNEINIKIQNILTEIKSIENELSNYKES